ncbi:uncharacterized protein LOC122306256 [Carya illinoinensis]|uniref:uncharacterized protein LOC122306256 n=1 Tax=Carya illinoinensis TaxID=32201 RepID=UPI001C718A5E|nr:uncharacterized protein LOC122306256 [Carya illinoinensis]
MERCYKLHGYPPGRKFFTKSTNSVALAKQTTLSHAFDLDKTSDGRVDLTQAQYQQLLALLQPRDSSATAQPPSHLIQSNLTSTNLPNPQPNLSEIMIITTHDHSHDPGVSSISIVCEGSLDLEKSIKMSSCQSTGATSTTLAPVRSEDPTWAHARAVPGARNNTECLYCNKIIRGGGITRLKYHLTEIPDNVEACKKVSEDVKWQMKELLDEMKRSKEKKRKISSEIGDDIDLTFDDIDDSNSMEGQSQLSKGKRKSGEFGTRKSVEGLSRFFAPRTTLGAQPSIKSSMCSNEMFVKAKMAVTSWRYDSNLPFNAAQSKFYQPAIDAVTAIGPGFKSLSLYELRGNLLKMAVNEIQDYLQQIKKVWNDTGCTLMTNGWTNQKQQSIINLLVYCLKGTMFLKSVDTSGLRKDAETLFNIFDEVVQEIGPENLMQFITNTDASYKAAGKKLQQKYGSFYWFPCAAHCINLMLENFSDPRYFLLIDDTIKKKELRQMFTCDKWIASSHSKSIIGKEIAGIVLEDKEFWAQYQFIVKISEPLVRVLRLVDGDEKAAMRYLYDAMERAKENIKARCNNKIELDPDDQDKIIAELDLYNNAVGEFGHDLAIRQRDKLNPIAWWTQFGCEVPTLQKFAVREHKKGRDALNPINLENIDLMEEWVSEESELLDGEDLNWASIEEPLISLNEEDVDNVGVDIDDGGDIDENILINMSNLDSYCLFDEDE